MIELFQKVIDRFFAKTIRAENGCLEWTGSTNGRPANGVEYGVFALPRNKQKKKVITAHRLAWIIANGEIPDGMFVCHKCDNPKCVDAGHLFLGTHLDNMRDMESKERRVNPDRSGESNGRAKLSDQQVEEIRKLKGTAPVLDIAKKFGIGRTQYYRIINHEQRASHSSPSGLRTPNCRRSQHKGHL